MKPDRRVSPWLLVALPFAVVGFFSFMAWGLSTAGTPEGKRAMTWILVLIGVAVVAMVLLEIPRVRKWLVKVLERVGSGIAFLFLWLANWLDGERPSRPNF